MWIKNLTIAVAVVALTAAIEIVAQAGQHGGHGGGGGMSMPMPTTPSVKTGKYTGKVISMDQSTITVEFQRKGQTETVTLLTTGETKTKGDVTVGAQIKVKYREDGAHKIATSIEAKKAKGA